MELQNGKRAHRHRCRVPASRLCGKALQGFDLVFVNLENGQQLRNHQEVFDFFRQVEQLEFAALIFNGGQARNEFADARTVYP